MDQEKQWMLITYYCPTHGDLSRVKPIEITNKTFFKRGRKSKNYFPEY